MFAVPSVALKDETERLLVIWEETSMLSRFRVVFFVVR